MLDVLGVAGRSDRWNDLRQLDLDRLVARATDMHLFWLADQVSGRRVPVLALALVHVKLEHVAVGAVERLVYTEYGLHIVFPVGYVAQAGAWIALCGLIDNGGLARRESVHVFAENLLRVQTFTDLEARLFFVFLRQYQQHAAIERRLTQLCGKQNLEARRLPRLSDGGTDHQQAECDKKTRCGS